MERGLRAWSFGEAGNCTESVLAADEGIPWIVLDIHGAWYGYGLGWHTMAVIAGFIPIGYMLVEAFG